MPKSRSHKEEILGGERETRANMAAKHLSSGNRAFVKAAQLLNGTADNPESPKGREQRKQVVERMEFLNRPGAFQTKKGTNIRNSKDELNRKKK